MDFSIPAPGSPPPPYGDPELTTGVTGNLAIARIWFIVNDDGTGVPPAPGYSWFRFTLSYLGDAQANKIAHPVYHGLYGSDNVPPEVSLIGTNPIPRPELFPYETPISTNWIEQFPMPGHTWHLSSFEDNIDLGLTASDQIDMTPTDPPGGVQWFHVDEIWECDADPNTFVYMLLTIKGPPVPEFPLGLGLMMMIAPAIAVAYLWRTRKKVTKP